MCFTQTTIYLITSVGECDRHAKNVLYVEGSVALVLGTSLFGGVGSNPTAAITFLTSRFFIYEQNFTWEK